MHESDANKLAVQYANDIVIAAVSNNPDIKIDSDGGKAVAEFYGEVLSGIFSAFNNNMEIWE